MNIRLFCDGIKKMKLKITFHITFFIENVVNRGGGVPEVNF